MLLFVLISLFIEVRVKLPISVFRDVQRQLVQQRNHLLYAHSLTPYRRTGEV